MEKRDSYRMNRKVIRTKYLLPLDHTREIYSRLAFSLHQKLGNTIELFTPLLREVGITAGNSMKEAFGTSTIEMVPIPGLLVPPVDGTRSLEREKLRGDHNEQD